MASIPRKKLGALWPSYTQTTNGRDYASAAALIAVTGYGMQVRTYDSKPDLYAEITNVIRDYGTRKAVQPEIMNEAVRLVLEKFGFLGANEIREAYRQHAAGETQTPAGEMYGGEFNARQLGAILEVYNERRKKIIADYLNAKAEERSHWEEEVRAAKAQSQFETNFFTSIIQARYDQTPWRKIPAAWYDFAEARGWIAPTKKEKVAAWNRAIDEYEGEKADLTMQEHTTKGSEAARELLRRMESGENAQARVIAISKKLLFHEKMIKA